MEPAIGRKEVWHNGNILESGYNSETKTVHIPNEEIKLEFQKSIREVNHKETIKRLEESDKLVGISYDKEVPAGERKHTCKIVKMCDLLMST